MISECTRRETLKQMATIMSGLGWFTCNCVGYILLYTLSLLSTVHDLNVTTFKRWMTMSISFFNHISDLLFQYTSSQTSNPFKLFFVFFYRNHCTAISCTGIKYQSSKASLQRRGTGN